MKQFLLTTNHLKNLAGSEIVALEIVEYFLGLGWIVFVVTNVFEFPIRGLFEALRGGERLFVTTNLDDDLDAEFDLIWIQHSLVPNALLVRLEKGAVTSPIVWHHMSTIEPIEAPLRPDIEGRIADVSTGVSPGVLDLLQKFGLPPRQLVLFENPSPDRFGAADLSAVQGEFLRVAVVSNHPPLELVRAIDILRDQGILVDVFGMGGTVRRIDAAVLSQYQAIISIGKTTQYALSMGIPVFVYDHFGGEGWLTPENIEREARLTFSGRSSMRRLSAEDLASEIVVGFPVAQSYSRSQRDYFRERWSLSLRMNELLADPRVMRPKIKTISPAEAVALRALVLLNRNLYLHIQRVEGDVRRLSVQASATAERLVVAEQALETMKATVSWRITRLLRAVRGFARRSERIKLSD
jgi:hypothetical protein